MPNGAGWRRVRWLTACTRTGCSAARRPMARRGAPQRRRFRTLLKHEMPRLNVFFICTGVGIYNRGIESFFREAYDGLRVPLERDGITARLFKGGESDVPERREKRLWCLPRTGKA